MTFSELSVYFQKLEKTASRNTMTEILAELFRRAAKGEIGQICYLLQGRVAPLYEAIEFGVADKFMIRAIALATGVGKERVRREFKKVGDLGTAAERIKSTNLQISKSTNRNASIHDIYHKLYELALTTGEGSQEKKIELLAGLLRNLDPLSVRYIVRIPLDKLRLGFSDMTILDALSFLLMGDKSARQSLENAYNVRPDIGYLAETAKTYGLKGLSHVKARVGVPILPCLCQRLPSADEMIEKMGKVGVEPKYDGVRVAIHYKSSAFSRQSSDKIRTFSRNLENTTAMFPELGKIEKQINAQEVILDSEAVGMDPKTGKLIPFQETVTRKRKHDIQESLLKVPLKFFVFDILYKDGQSLLGVPLSQRRDILERTVKPGGILLISPQSVTDSVGELRRYHDEQLKNGFEGAVVKKWDSPYESGRRGFTWVKFKEEEGKTGKLSDTIDAVVMGYYRGEGKRVGFGIGALLVGVRNKERFVTLTKIGTGVSDEQWQELRARLDKIKANDKPKEYAEVEKALIPDVWITPRLVVEIAGDDLTKSPTHGAGLAVRFPRLVRVRDDKSAWNTTTLTEVRRLYQLQNRFSSK